MSAFRLAVLSTLPAFSLLAACSGPQAQQGQAALVASETAHAYGVDHYLVAAGEVSLFDRTGAKLGTLRLSAPSATTRLVEIRSPHTKEIYTDEISNPVDGAFRAPLEADSREAAVQLDPALAGFFAAQDLVFQAVARADESIAPSDVAYCSDITWAAGCGLCGSSSDFPCYTYAVTGGTAAHGYAHCPPDTCSGDVANPYDIVHKTRTCNPTCTQQANGFLACADGRCVQNYF